VLGAGATAIAGGGEESVMTAGRCVRVIVTILCHRIRLGHVVVIFRPRGSVIVAMVGSHLVVMIVRSVLRGYRRWDHSGQCERECGENKRL
jgi:hypothetical protein